MVKGLYKTHFHSRGVVFFVRAFGLGLGLLLFFSPKPAPAAELSDVLQVGTAFLAQLGVHESGHYIMAHMAGAEDVDLSFFTRRGNSLFLGLSTARGLNAQSRIPYKMAGEVTASYHFELMLKRYRRNPTLYNRSVLFFSGADFFFYSLYAFYLSPERNPAYDPVGFSQETGLSPPAIVAMAALQSALNAYRAASGNDTLTPYFTMDRRSVEWGIRLRF